MIPLVILSATLVLLVAAGRLGVRRFADPVVALRFALAAMFLFTGWSHFGPMRSDLVRMVPPFLPEPELLVTLTGIAELAGAAGLLVTRLAPWAGSALAVLLVAMFPANVHAAREGLSVAGAPVLGVVPRGLMQLAFIAAAITAGWGHRWSKGSRGLAAPGGPS